MAKKKNNSGRNIFIFILLLILIAAGYFGYKYYLEGKVNTSIITSLDEKAEFPVLGTWYVNDSGEDYSDNALNFSEYTFESPTNVDGKLTGTVNTVHFQNGNSTHTGNYVIIGENKLRLSFPQEMSYEFEYVYFPEEQKVEMNFAGQKRTLIRQKPVSQEPTPQSEAEVKAEEEKVQTQLWMDKIANVDWKGDANESHIIRFSNPTNEGDIITGEYEEHYPKRKTSNHKYERLADGLLKLNNGTTLKMELDEEGNILTISNGYSTFIFKR